MSSSGARQEIGGLALADCTRPPAAARSARRSCRNRAGPPPRASRPPPRRATGARVLSSIRRDESVSEPLPVRRRRAAPGSSSGAAYARRPGFGRLGPHALRPL